jgi:hypothetical protein
MCAHDTCTLGHVRGGTDEHPPHPRRRHPRGHVPAALAGSASYYGANGAYAGSSITRNGHITFTNSGGAYVAATTRGRTTTLTGANGSRVGSVTRTGR